MARICPFPYWNTNPYLNMLYLGARARGWIVGGPTHYSDLRSSASTLGAGDVLHIHWTSPLAENIRGRADYRDRINDFESILEDVVARDVRVFWNVHNAIAHDSKYVEEEVRIAELLARYSEKIIVLNSHTADAVAQFYQLPLGKIVHIPHASYVGIYPEAPSSVRAKELVGVPCGSLTTGFVGAIRPYKGIGTFLSACGLLSKSVPNLAVVLAGNTSAYAMGEVESTIPRNVLVARKHTLLTDRELALWVAAVDIMVLPYRRILNSGTMMLASTFGVPCILPGEPHLVAEFGKEKWVEFFEVSAKDRSAEIVRCANLLRSNLQERREAARDFSKRYTMLDMSDSFEEVLIR